MCSTYTDREQRQPAGTGAQYEFRCEDAHWTGNMPANLKEVQLQYGPSSPAEADKLHDWAPARIKVQLV